MHFNYHFPLCFDVYMSTAKKNVQKYEARYQNTTQDCNNNNNNNNYYY